MISQRYDIIIRFSKHFANFFHEKCEKIYIKPLTARYTYVYKEDYLRKTLMFLGWLLRKQNLLRDAHPFRSPRGRCRLLLIATVCVVLGSAMWEILDWLLRKLNLLRDAHPFRSPRGPLQT